MVFVVLSQDFLPLVLLVPHYVFSAAYSFSK